MVCFTLPGSQSIGGPKALGSFNRAGVWEEAWEEEEAACVGISFREGANKEKEMQDGNLRCGRTERHFWRRALEPAINSKEKGPKGREPSYVLRWKEKPTRQETLRGDHSNNNKNNTRQVLGREGLPRWLGGKESACRCKRCRFNPWSRKIPWRSKWQPTPVFLPGKCHGQRSLAGHSPWARKESDTPLQLNSNNVGQWKIDILMGNPEVVWPHSMCSKIKSISTYRASLVTQLVKNLPAVQKTWVGKIPWRRERLPTPVFWPGEFHGLYSAWACKESDTTEPLSLSPSSTYTYFHRQGERDSGSWHS